MIELSNPIKDVRQTGGDVARLIESEQSRSLNSWQRHQRPQGFSVKNLMQGLQNRFSHTGDLDFQIQSLVEERVHQRTRELFRQANYDSLTHLPNRSYFHNTIEKLVIDAKADSEHFSLLFLDLDGFKAVNDKLGHQFGDELLRNVAARLISAVREGDIVSRLGGDEFVILLADVEDRELVENICRRIVDEVSRPYLLFGKDVEISTSIGVSRFPEDGVVSNELVNNADKALYDAKHSGRRTYRFYGDMTTQAAENWGQLIEDAVAQNQISVLFEPQIDIQSDKVVGASITASWEHQQLASPYLSAWLNHLNQSKVAYGFGLWLLDSALFYLQKWSAKQDDSLMVSVPVIDALWKQGQLVDVLHHRLQKYQLSASQLQLEFSAQELNQQPELKTVLMNLSQAGYQITLTDIASAPLDIALISQLNVQELKVDVNKAQPKWLSAMVAMAKSLDICVIASGLEDPQQLVVAKQAGCSMVQGEYWSKPVAGQIFQQIIDQQ